MKRWWQKEVGSFQNAWRGVVDFIKTEPHARFHILAMVVALGCGIALDCTVNELAILFTVSAIVICCEMLNTSLEVMCDLVHPDEHPLVKRVKDIAAGSVLIASIVALTVGIIIFMPRLLQ